MLKSMFMLIMCYMSVPSIYFHLKMLIVVPVVSETFGGCNYQNDACKQIRKIKFHY